MENSNYYIKPAIEKLPFNDFLTYLRSSTKNYFPTKRLIEFMKTIGGKNKTGGKNGIIRLQYFLNAYIQEISLENLNKNYLSFCGNNHTELIKNSNGDDLPDFIFRSTTAPKAKMSVETKMYIDKESYFKYLFSTNMHNADYIFLYCIKDSAWYIACKEEDYQNIYSLDEINNKWPWLSVINFPSHLSTFTFYVPASEQNSIKLKDLYDLQVPETVFFNIR